MQVTQRPREVTCPLLFQIAFLWCSLIATVVAAPVITQQPQSQTLSAGTLVSFLVEVEGPGPFSYQWRKGGLPISGANTSSFAISSAAISDSGFYSVEVGNGETTVSSNAILRIIPPPQQLASVSDTWKYNQSGSNLGSPWRQLTYDDSLWPSGSGLFGKEDTGNPDTAALIQTSLNLLNSNNAHIVTYYFRKFIPRLDASQIAGLFLTNYLDDGAIFYLNGVEFARFNLPKVPSPISYQTTALAPMEAFPVVTNVAITLPQSQDSVLAMEVHSVGGADDDIVFGTSIGVRFTPTEPVNFTLSPLSQNIFLNSSVSFTSKVAGTSPILLQWFKDGVPLTGQTNLELNLSQCTYADAGSYVLQASNIFGLFKSDAAELKVFSRTSIRQVLVPFAQTWKYNSQGLDLGTAWRSPGYDDSGWPSGQGIFASFFDYPEAINTFPPLTNASGSTVTTHYFRTHFYCPFTNSQTVLIGSNLVDDGAVFYLNGQEALRIRLASPSDYGTPAANSPDDGHTYEVFAWPITNLVLGDNTLAAEVHQTSSGAPPDIAFGLSLALETKTMEPLSISKALADQIISEHQPLALDSWVFGSPPFSIQWYRDGSPIAGATNLSFRLSSAHGTDSGAYHFIARNSFIVVTSHVAQVSVLVDETPPVIVDATAQTLKSVFIRFNEAIDPASATATSNYICTPYASISSIGLASSNGVVLSLDSSQVRQVSVSNLRDRAVPGNSILPNSTVSVSFNPNTLGHPFTALGTVFLIVFENQSWDVIVGSTNAPYFNSILPAASYTSQYFSPPDLHGSLSRYLWLEAGTNFGIANDAKPSFQHFNAPHLTALLDQAGVSWKAYQEDISGSNCPTTGISPYAVRHNPVMYFDDVLRSFDYCTNHLRPYKEMAADLMNNRVPRFCYIKPNTTNDMHDRLTGISSIKVGDNWLASELPKILNSPAFTNNGAVFLTWDEASIGKETDAIGLIVLSPLAKGGGYVSSKYYTHSATLRTFQEIFGVRPFLGDAANGPDLSDLFKLLAIGSLNRVTGQTQITVTNTIPGRTNFILASTDLVSWTTISTNVSTTNFTTIIDATSPSVPNRFYKVTQSQ